MLHVCTSLYPTEAGASVRADDGTAGRQVPAARRSDGPTAAGRDAASRTAGPTGSPCAAAGASGRQLPGAAGVGAAAPAAAPGVRVGARLGQAPGHGMVVRQGCPCNTRGGRCDRLVMHPVKVRAIHGPAAGIRSFARVSLDAGMWLVLLRGCHGFVMHSDPGCTYVALVAIVGRHATPRGTTDRASTNGARRRC